jgi:ATP-dependent helicase HepA
LQPLKDALSENESLAGLQRRAEAFLPPWAVTLHIDSNLDEVSDSEILSILERPYQDSVMINRGRSVDFNLGSRIEALHNVIEPGLFRTLCRQVRDFSDRQLRESPVFKERLSKAIGVANIEIKHRNERLIQRQKAQQGEYSSARDVNHEISLNEMLLQSIEKPLVRLDAIGFFVIAGFLPNNQNV